jgi:hypothetical protein
MDQPDLTDTARLRRLYSGRVARRRGGEDCVTPEAILQVVRREGDEDARLATLEHVMSCAACHREYEWLSAVDEAGREAERAAGASRRPWWSRSAPLALAASLVIAAGTALLVSRSGTDVERGGDRRNPPHRPGCRRRAGGAAHVFLALSAGGFAVRAGGAERGRRRGAQRHDVGHHAHARRA